MLEGFWILQIETPQVTSGGVIVFLNGKLFGGDNGFTWVGTYQESGQLVKARLNVHNFDSSVPSILGIPGDYEMHFSGTVQENHITGTVVLANQPQHSLGVRMVKRASLQ